MAQIDPKENPYEAGIRLTPTVYYPSTSGQWRRVVIPLTHLGNCRYFAAGIFPSADTKTTLLRSDPSDSAGITATWGWMIRSTCRTGPLATFTSVLSAAVTATGMERALKADPSVCAIRAFMEITAISGPTHPPILKLITTSFKVQALTDHLI